jgi:hypothetical protein
MLPEISSFASNIPPKPILQKNSYVDRSHLNQVGNLPCCCLSPYPSVIFMWHASSLWFYFRAIITKKKSSVHIKPWFILEYFGFLPVRTVSWLVQYVTFGVSTYGLESAMWNARHRHKLCCLLVVLTFDIAESSKR